MPVNPMFGLFGPTIMLWMGGQYWRQKRLRRAQRDLPTRMQRLLGPEPEYDLPKGEIPEGLQAYAAEHRRTARIKGFLSGAGALWALYIIYLIARKQFP